MNFIEKYKSSITLLQMALNENNSEFSKDAAIHRFRLCVGLAIKAAQEYSGFSGDELKSTVREMGRAGLVDDVEVWLKAVDNTNKCKDAFDVQVAEDIIKFSKIFIS